MYVIDKKHSEEETQKNDRLLSSRMLWLDLKRNQETKALSSYLVIGILSILFLKLTQKCFFKSGFISWDLKRHSLNILLQITLYIQKYRFNILLPKIKHKKTCIKSLKYAQLKYQFQGFMGDQVYKLSVPLTGYDKENWK